MLPQITLDDTFEKVINNFFIKLQKPREAIKRFIFDGNEISPYCKQKLRDLGITRDSQIFAVKSVYFDIL